jgi:hypothetical protein
MIPRGAAPHEGDPWKCRRIGEGPSRPQTAAAVLAAGYEWRGTPTQPRSRRQTQTRSARSPAGRDPTAHMVDSDGFGDAEAADVGVDPGHGTIVLHVRTAGEPYSWVSATRSALPGDGASARVIPTRPASASRWANKWRIAMPRLPCRCREPAAASGVRTRRRDRPRRPRGPVGRPGAREARRPVARHH